jgi:hypothetical protein
MKTAVAVAAVVYFLAHTIAQCGIFFTHDHGDEVHITATSPLPAAAEAAPGHAHIDAGSPQLEHDGHAVVTLPRADNPLRPLAVLALTLALAAAVAVAYLAAPRLSRGPPRRSPPARFGRTVLNDLCINRC